MASNTGGSQQSESRNLCSTQPGSASTCINLYVYIYIYVCVSIKNYQDISRYVHKHTHTYIYIILHYIILCYIIYIIYHYIISVCVNALVICQYVKYRWSSTKAASDRFGSVDLDHLRPARQSQIKNPIVLQPQISAATGDCPNRSEIFWNWKLTGGRKGLTTAKLAACCGHQHLPPARYNGIMMYDGIHWYSNISASHCLRMLGFPDFFALDRRCSSSFRTVPTSLKSTWPAWENVGTPQWW